MNYSKSSIKKNKLIEKLQLIVGILFTFTFGGTAINSTFDNVDDGVGVVVTLYILTALSLLIIVLSRKRRKLNMMYDSYVDRLAMNPTGCIDNLASTLRTSPDVVQKNLKELIKRHYFEKAYIDETNNRIVFADSDVSAVSQTKNRPREVIEYVTVNCKNCGGLNKVQKGKVQECEFCGSPIT